MGGQHLRVRPAGDQVPRPTGQIIQRTHRLDHPLDALSRPQQAPGQQGRSARHASRRRAVGRVAPCGMVLTLRRSTSKPRHRRCARPPRHHDHLIRPRRDRLEHRTLVRRRVFEDRVSDHDRRDPQPVDDIHHLVSVGTAVDAVLVLDDGDVAPVQQLGACRHRRRRAVDQLADDPGIEEGDPSATRTTPTSAPCADNPSASAALNVASPHAVGGCVLRMPKLGARQSMKLKGGKSVQGDPDGRLSPACPARAAARRVQRRTADLIPDWLGSQRHSIYTPWSASAG